MAIWSEVRNESFEKYDRLDAEFYQPIYLEVEEKLNAVNSVRLESLLTDIRYGLNVEPDYVDEGLPFIRAMNLKEYGIEGEVLKIPFEAKDIGELNVLEKGDLLIVRSGANVGDIGIVTDNLAGSTFGSYVIRLKPNKKIVNPAFLYVFLKSKFGREQTIRFRSGTAQPNISIPNLKEVLIYLPSLEKQAEIEKFLTKSYLTKESSKMLYQEAEELLLHELGLDALDLSDELTYERNFDEVALAGRLDAQYFAPRYQRTLKSMSKSGETIGDVAPIVKRIFRSKLADEHFEYIEIGSLTGDGRAESEKLLSTEAPSRAQWIVKKDDVITSTVRPIRRLSALIETQQEDFVCSSGFAVLEPKTIEAEVLLVWLRLPIISEILDLHTTATMYPAIAVDTLLRIPITKPSEPVSKQIIQKIQDSREAIKNAKQLLEDAKRRVEDMILGE
ncbi:MAG: restriction endonuclease subunit S [Pyrinomonadaceae bacterium]|nr:restriction endonuclease subunit S [Pyrinomonadaceae bacterium]